MRIPSVHDLFWAHRGLLSDKWEQYIPVYEAEFHAHLEQGAPVTLLEIGVQNGGSLEIWHKLLPPSSRIVGLDIDERCRDLKLSEGIELHIGDATKKDFINLALGETRFDFIIDDGSHRPEHVIASFELLFERLKPGGIYVVEDLHCSYWSAYNGGFRDPRSAIEWAKNLVDGLNADHIESPSELHGRELARLKAFNTEIARIAFFDSMLVVQKYPAAKLRPFARVFAGSQAPIADPVDWLFRVPTSDLKNWMAAPPVATRMNAELVRRYE
jgi:SAM-dependent methyltransferase